MDFDLFPGDDYPVTFEVSNVDVEPAVALDLTDMTATLRVRRDYVGSPVLLDYSTAEPADPLSIPTPANGEVIWDLTAAVSATLSERATFRYQLRIVDNAGDVVTVKSGTFETRDSV